MRAGDYEIKRIDGGSCSVVQYRGGDENVTVPGVFGKYRAVRIEGSFLRKGNSVRSLTIPSSVEEIDDDAFLQMRNLESISAEKGNRSYRSEDGVLYDSSFYSLVFYPPKKVCDDFIPPAKLGKISRTAFSCGAHFRTFAVPPRLEEFLADPSSFPELENFVSSGDAGKNGASAADGLLCRGKRLLFCPPQREGSSCRIPDGIAEIVSVSREPFFPAAVKRVSVPSSLEKGLGNAEGNVLGNAECVDVDASSLHYRSVGGVLFSWKRELLAYPGRRKEHIYVTPSGTETIGRGAFRGALLDTLIISSGVTSIQDSAFEASRISTIVIPESVTSINIHALYGAGSLKEIHAVKGSVADVFFSGEGLGHLLRLSERLF